MATDYRDTSPAYRGYALTLLVVMFTMANIDRSILSILIEPIRHEYSLSDTQIGLLTGLAFAIPLSIVIVPIGILADRTNRIRLVSLLNVVWSGLTIFTGMAQSFLMLVLTRAGLGAAEAGAAPIFTSLATDMFSKETRGKVMGWLYFSSPLGVTLGFALGGYIASHFHWRTAFFVIGAPSLLLTVLAILTVREPKREVIVGDHGPAKPSSIAAVVGLLRERSVLRYLVLAGAFSIGGQAACSAFMAPFFIRVHGLSIEQTGTMLALTYGVGGMIGMPLGGIISDAIHKRFPGRELAFFGWVNVLAAMIAAAAFLVPSWHVAMALIGIYAVSVVFYYAVIFATFMNETPGHLRAGAGATMLLAMNLFGYGLAPQFTGMVSDLSQSLGLADPLRFAQVCSGSLLMIGGLFLILAGREILRARASSTSQPSSASALAND